MRATAGSTDAPTQAAKTPSGWRVEGDARKLREIFCTRALVHRACISYLPPCSEHGARLGRNLGQAVLRRGGNPEAEGRLDGVDESATDSLNLFIGPGNGADSFLRDVE